MVSWWGWGAGAGGSGECAFLCFKPVKHLHLCCKSCLKIFTRTIPHHLFKVDDLHNYKIHSHEKGILKKSSVFYLSHHIIKKTEKLPIIIPPRFPCSITQTPHLCCSDAAASSRVAPSHICPPSHLLPSFSHDFVCAKDPSVGPAATSTGAPSRCVCVCRHLQPPLASSSHRLLPPHFLPPTR